MTARHQHNETLNHLHALVMETDFRVRQLRMRTGLVCDRLAEALDASACGAEDGWLRSR